MSFIFKENRYVNDMGQLLIEREAVVGEVPAEFGRYSGVGNLRIETQRGPIVQPFTFKIEAESVVDAFAKYETSAKAGAAEAIDAMKSAEMQHAKRLIVPSGVTTK